MKWDNNAAGELLCLPEITASRKNHYRKQTTKTGKVRRNLWYTDQLIETTYEESAEIVEAMERRERFGSLRDFVKKLLRTHYNEYRTRFILDTQTVNDAYLAMIYINHHLREDGYHLLTSVDYGKLYKYHMDWRHKPAGKAEGAGDNEAPAGKEAVLSAPPQQGPKPEKMLDADAPVWMLRDAPVFFEPDSHDANEVICSEDFCKHNSLVFALKARTAGFRPQMGIVFDDDNEWGVSSFGFPGAPSSQERHERLLLSGFKTIHIPGSGTDELREIFGKLATHEGMKLSKTLNFETLQKEYGQYFKTEQNMLAVVESVKELKLFSGRKESPVVYKDFIALFDTARKADKAKKKRKCESKNPWDELNSMIGNEGIKREVRKMVDLLLLEKRRKEFGLPQTRLTMHSVFYGSPGTSKTTVARLIARILEFEGINKSANFKECVKSDIVGQFVGWTAERVDSMFKELSNDGGVLFLDEAYTYTDDQTCFDKEAINCIVQGMENHRNVMCIFAGYKQPMQQFVDSNPGIRSRIGFVFEFSDYTAQEMYDIAQYQAKELGFALPISSRKMLVSYFADIIKMQGEFCGNGREARKIVEASALELASRLSRHNRKASKAECSQLTAEDIGIAIQNSLERERLFAKKRAQTIGFAG